MKLNNGIKTLLTGLAILTLASCAHNKKNSQFAVNDSNSAYRNGAQVSHWS